MPVSLVKHQSQRKTLTDQRQGNGNLLLKYCHGAALQKHNQEMEIYRACSKYDTFQIKTMHTAKFSLNPIRLLIPHALRLVCFPYVILEEQMSVLHIHPSCPSIKINSKYLWPPVHSPSATIQYLPFTSACSFFHAHILSSLPTHSYCPNQTLSRITPKAAPKPPACQCHWSPFCLSSIKLLLLSFPHFILTPQSHTQNSDQFLVLFLLICLLTQAYLTILPFSKFHSPSASLPTPPSSAPIVRLFVSFPCPFNLQDWDCPHEQPLSPGILGLCPFPV